MLLVLVYFIFKKNKKWITNLAVFNMLVIGVYLILMINKVHLLIILPLVITNLVQLAKITFKNSKPIPVVI
jgi:hypothetical protein